MDVSNRGHRKTACLDKAAGVSLGGSFSFQVLKLKPPSPVSVEYCTTLSMRKDPHQYNTL
jgi:hypothetical protein